MKQADTDRLNRLLLNEDGQRIESGFTEWDFTGDPNIIRMFAEGYF